MKKIRIISLCLALCLFAGLFTGCKSKKGNISQKAVMDEADFEDAFGE